MLLTVLSMSMLSHHGLGWFVFWSLLVVCQNRLLQFRLFSFVADAIAVLIVEMNLESGLRTFLSVFCLRKNLVKVDVIVISMFGEFLLWNSSNPHFFGFFEKILSIFCEISVWKVCFDFQKQTKIWVRYRKENYWKKIVSFFDNVPIRF